MKLWKHPPRSLQSLQRFKNNHKHNDNSTSNKDAQFNHGLNLRYYHPYCRRGNNHKTYLQITQEDDEGQF